MPNVRCSHRFISMFLAAMLVPAFPFASWAQQPDKTEILKKARQSYYSLKTEGLNQVTCNMVPDWNYLLEEQRKADPTNIDAAIKKLEGLRFMLAVDAEGKATVTHSDLPAENEQVASGLKQIYSGMEQMGSGFFQTWSAYTITPGLPEPGSDFQLESVAGGYRVSNKDGDSDISTAMDKNFAINDQVIKTKEFEAEIKPQFQKSNKGLILSAYDATYRGQTPAQNTVLSVGIVYQEISGLQFPQEITLSGSYGANPFRAKLAFTTCQASKH